MKEKIPVQLILFPPIISALVIGLGSGLVAFGLGLSKPEIIARDFSFIMSGSGTIIGFFFGTLVWSDKLAGMYGPRPMRVMSNDTVMAPEIVRIELRQENGDFLNVKYVDLPAEITMEQMKAIASHLVSNGFVFSHALAGKHMPLNRSQLEILRDLLISRGLAKWNNPHARNQGVVLTKAGESLFRQLAAHSNGRPPKIVQALA